MIGTRGTGFVTPSETFLLAVNQPNVWEPVANRFPHKSTETDISK